MSGCESDRDYHCATHDRPWFDDEFDQCEYKRMVDAEAALERVKDWCRVAIQADAEDLTYNDTVYVRAWCAHEILDEVEGRKNFFRSKPLPPRTPPEAP